MADGHGCPFVDIINLADFPGLPSRDLRGMRGRRRASSMRHVQPGLPFALLRPPSGRTATGKCLRMLNQIESIAICVRSGWLISLSTVLEVDHAPTDMFLRYVLVRCQNDWSCPKCVANHRTAESRVRIELVMPLVNDLFNVNWYT